MTQVSNSVGTQLAFDYSVFDEDTRVFAKTIISDVQVRLKRTADDIIAIGDDLIALRARIEHGLFLQLLKGECDMSQASAYRFMAVSEKGRDNPEFITVINSKNIGPGRVLYALAEASDDTIAKVSSGEIPTTAEAIQDRKRAERAEEKARKEEQARLEAERKAESLEQQALLFQAEAQLVKSENEALRAKDRATIEHVLQEEKRNLQREYQIKRSEKEKELKEEYADRYQQYQLKAETTIHSLISHGKKRMAETQMTIEHTVSSGMLQAVQELGGKQVDSLLAQIRALRETLDLAEIKLISSSSTDIVEATVVIDSRIS
jgi:hypothetical protein